jgi:hypothetical protein
MRLGIYSSAFLFLTLNHASAINLIGKDREKDDVEAAKLFAQSNSSIESKSESATDQCCGGMGHLHSPYYPAMSSYYHDPYLGYPYPSTVGGYYGA